ncbi:hypothetical protein [Burkholderia ubonensis]|uniref:hypothetical protein n=1 Tax=Burkholderia ubonensis TaxID=101571 RepID=UPI0012F841EC|nr:hypothetical protein [Burkholderia ubonensis]
MEACVEIRPCRPQDRTNHRLSLDDWNIRADIRLRQVVNALIAAYQAKLRHPATFSASFPIPLVMHAMRAAIAPASTGMAADVQSQCRRGAAAKDAPTRGRLRRER